MRFVVPHAENRPSNLEIGEDSCYIARVRKPGCALGACILPTPTLILIVCEPSPHAQEHSGPAAIATANIRDRGVHEMSSALKRRFNFETVHPIGELTQEVALVTEQCQELLREAAAEVRIGQDVVEVLVTAFHDLREGVTADGVQVEKPTTVMSTAEAVSVALQASLDAFYYGDGQLTAEHVGRHLAGAVIKDSPDDLKKLKHYFDVVVRQRSKDPGGAWAELGKARPGPQRGGGHAIGAARVPDGIVPPHVGIAVPRGRPAGRRLRVRFAGRRDGEPAGAGHLARAARGPALDGPARAGHGRLSPGLFCPALAGEHAR